MPTSVILSLSALLSMLPASLLPFGDATRRERLFWLLLAPAIVGPAAWVVVQMYGRWYADLSGALWVTVAATMVLFAGLSLIVPASRRLAPLLLPYLVLLGILATVLRPIEAGPFPGTVPGLWTQAHIVMSVMAYALLTLSAVSGFAVFLQERALKRKQPTKLTRLLPAVAEGERLQIGLLVLAEILLGLGVATGMAVNWTKGGGVLALDHKSILSIIAFGVVLALLLAHWLTGLRGRMAARLMLIAFLLLTLAYPGVKFVADILLG
ncbi:MAG: cytochrome c biogenesis protein CcsA [Oceanibaculum nanhaiense]|jgi:ABC-type uncharacterized transport system permease subunit|uniref:cytochrome C assembly family protein n=1 Tax=Oceanibaculum nanhaiense TaxID=1909734 RepID=UPI0032EECA7B